MKITDQTIPPELAALYAKLISRKPTLAGTSFAARTKPRALKKAPKRKKRKSLRDYEAAVEMILDNIMDIHNSPSLDTLRVTLLAELKRGNFNLLYWVQCEKTGSIFLKNFPTSAPWTGTRNYAYPDPTNMPSIPTYGAGTTVTSYPLYRGYTVDNTFKDYALRWRRSIFKLSNPCLKGDTEPVYLSLVGNIYVEADVRPSRAMLSAIIKHWLVKNTSDRLTTVEAPTSKPISALWRYKTPRGEAPYFNLVHPLRTIYNMRAKTHEESAGGLKHCVILTAPMPMMGKRFNNNTYVTTALDAEPQLFQIKKCTVSDTSLSFVNGGNRVAAGVTHDSGNHYDDTLGQNERYSITGFYPDKIYKKIIDGAVSENHADWLYPCSGNPQEVTLEIVDAIGSINFVGNKGADKDLFNLRGNWLSFKENQDVAAPKDLDKNNVYETCVGAYDVNEHAAREDVKVTVKNFYNARIHVNIVNLIRGERLISTTIDGIAWSYYVEGMPTAYNWIRPIWAGNHFYAIASGQNVVCKSQNGIVWTSSTSLPTVSNWSALAFNGTYLLAIASGSTEAATSPDGITWTARTLPAALQWCDAAWNGTIWCVIAINSTQSATSPDGIIWTLHDATTTHIGGRSICSNGDIFCKVTNFQFLEGYPRVFTSRDGFSWVSLPMGDPQNINWLLQPSEVFWTGTSFIVSIDTEMINYAPYPYVYRSLDGIHWLQHNMPLPGMFIAGDGTMLIISQNVSYDDGITWEVSNYPVWFAVGRPRNPAMNTFTPIADANEGVGYSDDGSDLRYTLITDQQIWPLT